MWSLLLVIVVARGVGNLCCRDFVTRVFAQLAAYFRGGRETNSPRSLPTVSTVAPLRVYPLRTFSKMETQARRRVPWFFVVPAGLSMQRMQRMQVSKGGCSAGPRSVGAVCRAALKDPQLWPVGQWLM